jgi:hypothetical protein
MGTLYTVTVDTEEEWDWSSGWPAAAASVRNVRELPRFQEICDRHEARVTYFTNYAVLNDPESLRIILGMAQRPNVEIGMHIHPWNTPPYRHNGTVQARESFLHNAPPDLIQAKLATVYERFLEVGLKPVSFRGGRYSSGLEVQNFLRSKGFVADSSVVPFTTWTDDGAPDYRRRRLAPQRLAPSENGRPFLWEIPLSMGFSRRPFPLWHRITAALGKPMLRRMRLVGLAEKLGLVRRVWLNFEDPAGQRMLPLLRVLRRMGLPHVCFTLHSSSLMAGGSSYTPDEAARQRLLAYVDEILEQVRGWEEFKPATVAQIALHLEKAHAGSRN